MQGAFYGIGAAVIAIIARSAWKLMRSTLERDVALWIIFLVSAAVTAWTESEIVWLFLAAGVVYLLVRLPAAARARMALVLPWPLLSRGSTGRRTRARSGASRGTSPRPAPSCSGAASRSCPSSTAAS